MNLFLVVIALFWGLLAGYLALRFVDSLLGLLFCVHGLFARRWKKLADRNATDLIRPRLIIKLGLRLGCYALVCGLLLDTGDELLRHVYKFRYAELPGLLFAVAATGIIFSRLFISWKRLKLVWRMSHEFDFAARRERTRLLKG